jgi:hypothetical protein
VYTLHDLRVFGRKQGWCPYFLARHMMSFANVVVYNYQYMIDPKVSQVRSCATQLKSTSQSLCTCGAACMPGALNQRVVVNHQYVIHLKVPRAGLAVHMAMEHVLYKSGFCAISPCNALSVYVTL